MPHHACARMGRVTFEITGGFRTFLKEPCIPVAEQQTRDRAASNPPSELEWSDLDKSAVDVIRGLAMDAVEAAGSGHPGTAMSLAPAAYLLFQRLLRHDPTEPGWVGRDRFVL